MIARRIFQSGNSFSSSCNEVVPVSVRSVQPMLQENNMDSISVGRRSRSRQIGSRHFNSSQTSADGVRMSVTERLFKNTTTDAIFQERFPLSKRQLLQKSELLPRHCYFSGINSLILSLDKLCTSTTRVSRPSFSLCHLVERS